MITSPPLLLLLLLWATPAVILAQDEPSWSWEMPSIPGTDEPINIPVTPDWGDQITGFSIDFTDFFNTDVPETDIPVDLTTRDPAPVDLTTQVPAVVTEQITVATAQPWDDEKKPRITTHPRNVTVAPGSIANFRCEATGTINPMMVIVKEDSDFEIPEFHKDNRDESDQPTIEQDLLVGPVTQLDEGWYVCIAANYYGNIRSKAYLKVLDLCASVECKLPKVCVQDYNTATASCACPRMICDETNFDPVCGSDCKTHYNPCTFNATSCENDYDSSTILFKGQCATGAVFTEPEVELLNDVEMIVEEEDMVKFRARIGGNPLPSVEWLKVDKDGEIMDSVGKGAEIVIPSVTPAMSGRYVARATNCETDHQFSRSFVLEVEPKPVEPEKEINTEVNVCSIFGDPHILTYDSHTFNFAGECTYLLSMDCTNFYWLIYGDFTPCGAGTCLEQVTIFINHRPVILMRGWIINIDGEKREFLQGETVNTENMVFTFDGMILTGRNDDIGLTVRWDGFLSVQIGVDQNIGGSMCGVCGNNDQDDDNEHRQATKLDDGLIDSMEPNVYTDNWKIDRERMCVLSPNVMFNPSEPCGSNYGKSQEAKEVCQNLVENPALQRCKDTVDLKFYYEGCLYDYCYLDLLREEEDPFLAGNDKPFAAVECTTARAYVSHCELRGIDMRGWDSYMTCDVEKTQDAIISISCPQVNQPFVRFRR